MNNVVFHIGWPKSASSYLQSEVFPSLGDSVDYNPTDFSLAMIKFMRASYIKKEHDHEAFLNLEIEFKKILRPDRLFLYSNEGLCPIHYGNSVYFKIFTEALYKLCPFAKLLLVLRDVESWTKSMYHTLTIHQKVFRSYESYTSHSDSEDFKLNYNFLDHQKLVSYYESFGFLGGVSIIQFDLIKENVHDFVNSVVDVLDVNVDFTVFSKDKVNASRSKSELLALSYLFKITGIEKLWNEKYTYLPYERRNRITVLRYYIWLSMWYVFIIIARLIKKNFETCEFNTVNVEKGVRND